MMLYVKQTQKIPQVCYYKLSKIPGHGQHTKINSIPILYQWTRQENYENNSIYKSTKKEQNT